MTQKDSLGYDVYARTLWSRIQAALNKDHENEPLGDDPLVVGIFGEWGAGKSHLLKLLLQQAKDQSTQKAQWRKRDGGAGFDLTVPVFFQPWKYEHEEHLLVPLILHIYADLQKTLKEAQSFEDITNAAAKTAYTSLVNDMGEHLPELCDFVEANFSELVNAVKTVLGEVIPGLGVLTKLLPALLHKMSKSAKESKKPITRINTSLRFENNGRHYYEIHESLQAVTRPRFEDQAALKAQFNNKIRINFVVFIDDLDRCLPEKAVQTLELIKTVFNVESFAFVLALDDEVIERGIGHRYKEYKLQDKKPEMPITGFEYLEKIVHLPFRLPGLTQEQARRFIVQYEVQTADKGQALWFSVQETSLTEGSEMNTPSKLGGAQQGDTLANSPHDLVNLVIASFDAYVPRKLIRIVELMRQVMFVVQKEHGKTITANGSPHDVRVILALLLVQLFQPELYRLTRRRVDVFPSLYGGFVRGELGYPTSDIDLWLWVDQMPKNTAPPSATGQSKVVDALNPYEAAVQRISDIAKTNDKADAQYVRLPLVAQLVEHRAVQRHVFNVLRMIQALVPMLQPAKGLGEFSLYMSLLSAGEPPSNVAARVAVPKDQRQRFAVGNIDSLFQDLTSTRDEVYENLAGRQEWPTGEALDSDGAQKLMSKLLTWIEEDATSSDGRTRRERCSQVLKALPYLAPYLAQEDGAGFWTLVSGLGEDLLPDDKQANTLTPDPAQASLYLDVQSMLGQDHRFERDHTPDSNGPNGPNGATLAPLYLLKEPWAGHGQTKGETQEPLPGFVRIPKGVYAVGDPEVDKDNPKAKYTLAADIYMGRTPVTVDQYSAFVAGGGYGDNEQDEKAKPFWDDQGWAWRHNSASFQRAVPADANYRQWLDQRSGDLRSQPWGWADQQGIGSCAVHGITWYEARAYARWLDAQLHERGKLGNKLGNKLGDKLQALRGYRVSLPNEWQWEIAARAQFDDLQAPLHRWPWGNEKSNAGQRANIKGLDEGSGTGSTSIKGSGIGHASVPGCFAPNAAGLLDMAGNVWEWQDGLFVKAGKTQDVSQTKHQLLPKSHVHALTDNWETSDRVALRGGSWILDPQYAACSCRGRDLAVDWYYDLGFRVMLSLAQTNSET